MILEEQKYKIRASKSLALVTSCSTKVKNKLEWVFNEDKKEDYSDAFIKIAVAVFNQVEYGYKPLEVFTYDLHNGKVNEPLGVQMYDKRFGTNFYEMYQQKDKTLPFEIENEYSTGTRDFGDNLTTIDAKNSTCLNVFSAKKFIELEHDYIGQKNTYGLLYKTPKLLLYNYLTPKDHELKRAVDNKRFFDFYSDAECDEYQEELERTHHFSNIYQNINNPFFEFEKDVKGMTLEQITDVREVPKIANWEETLYKSVQKMNRFLEANKHRL